MNYSTAVMLINENIRAVNVTYSPDKEDETQNRYTFKTLDPTIEKGDYVVVGLNSRGRDHDLIVVQVDEVDVDVNFEHDRQIKWILTKINLAESEEIAKEEAKWIEQIQKSEIRKKKKELKEGMLDMYEEDGIDKMAIAHMGSDVPAIGAAPIPPGSDAEIETDEIVF